MPPLLKIRIKALKFLSQENFYTMARIQPLFPNILKKVSNELIPSLGEAGVKHAIIEFFNYQLMRNYQGQPNLYAI